VVRVLLLGIGGEGHDGPYLSDSIILAQIKLDTNEVSLTSLPRDYQVKLPQNYGYRKINAAFAEGFNQHKDWNEAGTWAHRKYRPLVFTEQGVAMLSGVLNSERAIRVNVAIMRTFVRIRKILLEESLSHRVTELEKGSDKLFRIVFERLDTLEMAAPILSDKRRKIGLK
jgi:anionic cell wall polymer biosynthesis LytR-Cps2A-Psr (LCP) family protein